MNKYLILCIDDEREVLDSVLNDLGEFESHFAIEACESVEEAREVLQEYQQEGTPLALALCDHIMPDVTGVEFLISLTDHDSTRPARKLLLTGQAGLEETVEAVNHASLDYFIAKPWKKEQLQSVITEQLTTYIIENEKELMPWIQVLDAERILKAMSDNRTSFGE
ncbi:response regulator [Thaumasiovibrio subtropicus]|uniref:response regulator n=1 Tax=Thaumasiovibrio subtropicus TaxID=1891207 RepID=UPI000B3511B5|nr:response regulator [Thaumasiovibrio subtropicus]